MNKISFFIVLFCVLCLTQFAHSESVISSEYNRNLKQQDNTLLFDYHEQTLNTERHFFTYPRRSYAFVRDFEQNEFGSLIYYAGSSDYLNVVRSYGIAVSPILGLDYYASEVLADTIWPSVDGGVYMRGYADSMDFDLNVRMLVEQKMSSKVRRYDADYRGHLGFNYAWARISLARDVLHWGPSYYNNLCFNYKANPYNMFALDITLGPLHVFSVYSNLYDGIDGNEKINGRNLYAHRYELALKNVTIGVSETQVLYGENKPWLFTPVVPLFIEKGNYTEHVNNGAISFDMNYRLFQFARIYGEFFLDDMVSPVALYENKYNNNRWAATFGIQLAKDVRFGHKLLQLGSLSEIARIEPYTYCHFGDAPAIMAHQGELLSNPNGPNSLTIDWMLYGKYWVYKKTNVFAGLHNKWAWKGEDDGSHIVDSYKNGEKRFIHDAPLHYSLMPLITYQGNNFVFSGEYSFFDDFYVNVRMTFMM